MGKNNQNPQFQLWLVHLVTIQYTTKILWKKLCGFHSFLLNCESFPMNHGPVNQQYQQKFSHR